MAHNILPSLPSAHFPTWISTISIQLSLLTMVARVVGQHSWPLGDYPCTRTCAGERGGVEWSTRRAVRTNGTCRLRSPLLCGKRVRRWGNDCRQLMDSAGKLGSLASRRASQGAELLWRGDRRGGHAQHSCPGSRGGRDRFWAGFHRVVRTAGDRHVVESSRLLTRFLRRVTNG
jgi:hypothetical protein